MSSLPTPLRRQLESAVKQARKLAEAGARHALKALAVHEPDPYQHMDVSQRALRMKLRAQAKQLGDGESPTKRGGYEIKHLAEKLAYDQWHRMLFARYLLENDLLISPEHGVAVSLDDCEELAPLEGLKDAWAVAARFAAKELPEIFRADDPAGAVELSVNDRQPLIGLVTGLAVDVFIAGDSLGWCYQFWQAEKKDEVNAAGNKIGADELPAVTQLFTEDYMVDFLLDNTLGAWHAGKVLAANPRLAESAQSEDELRDSVAVSGCPWSFLRFIKGDEGKWSPAAGTFDGWPRTTTELKCMDPCMGSGHFVVAMFERLVALRIDEEHLHETAAVDAVIRDNLFGLEIDPRCTQIAAFNLALAAWRRVGHRRLPTMNLACSGHAPNAKREDWLTLAGENDRLERGMVRLYTLFKEAPVLGSLINPRATGGDLLEADFHELLPLLELALTQESKDAAAHEMTVTARGLAKAAEFLAGRFTLVATNVPYLGYKKQDDVLKSFCEAHHPAGKPDLATCFVERGLSMCFNACTAALVTPQNWLFLGAYEELREKLLRRHTWQILARLGSGAFETITGEVVNVALVVMSESQPQGDNPFAAVDAAADKDTGTKATTLRRGLMTLPRQAAQLKNVDKRIIIEEVGETLPSLSQFCTALAGATAGDSTRFAKVFWEVNSKKIGSDWEFYLCAPQDNCFYASREKVILWEAERGQMRDLADSVKHLNHVAQNWRRGKPNWGKSGVAVSVVCDIPATIYSGEIYDCSCCALVPKRPEHLSAVWAFVESGEYAREVRKLDQKLIVTTATLLKVPFDIARWQKVAAEKYPRGLPKPFSSDATQWLFNGHPTGADQPLQVAVARLLGYRWPRQTGTSFPECPALGPDDLEAMADVDGIVPISPAKGEGPAAERLRELLACGYGKDWNATRQEALLAEVGFAGASVEDWLRNGFFEQHCALFQHRPFIWHVWDGLKNGFSALVNYHKLTHASLEKLTYSTLGNWIQRQQASVAAGEAGSDAKLQAAMQLQAKLKLILEGEPPYDIFVRWKPLAHQPIGWHPDLNDGVRMNIRPFVTADILRKRVKIKWEKDRGKEPERDKAEFPWFWCETEPDTDPKPGPNFAGNRWNDVHLSNAFKLKAKQ